MSDQDFVNTYTALQLLLDKAGCLGVTWLFLLSPVGVALQMIGMIIENQVPRWQGVISIVGMFLLINPDI
ncbi:MAG: hypothetical protein ACR2QW_10530 [bacterium]